MKKVKRIHGKNIGVGISFVRLAVYWLLWERVSLEWFRTLLILWLIGDLALVVFSALTSDLVDIFKDK